MIRSSTSSAVIAALVAAAALLGCQPSDPSSGRANPRADAAAESSAPLSPHAEPGGIAWLGDVEAAFAQARAQNKPVLLYWGAEWCVSCHELKAKLFTRPTFIEKTRQLVPVYLDGDDSGAQKWDEIFEVSAYPTMLVLRPDRSVLANFADEGLEQYAAVLDRALGKKSPSLKEILAARDAKSGPLSLEDCKRLAHSSYDAAAIDATRPEENETMRRIAQRCPPEARAERTRIVAMSTLAPVKKEARAVLLEDKAPSQGMQRAMRDLARIIDDPESLKAVSGMSWLKEMEFADEAYFDLIERSGAGKKAELYPRWLARLDARADDPSLPTGDRLDALHGKLKRAQGLDSKGRDSKGQIPAALAAQARRHVETALAGTGRNTDERAGVVETSTRILSMLGDEPRMREIYTAEIATAKDPTYYMGRIAILDEGRGDQASALEWLERAYREAKGPATRLWRGVDYVHALVRHRPQDKAAIRDGVISVLGELEGPDRIYNRTREQLDRLNGILRQWNSTGRHDQGIAAIRDRMGGICETVPSSETSAREACDGFLAVKSEPIQKSKDARFPSRHPREGGDPVTLGP